MEVTRWKTVEGSVQPVKITDAPAADVDWTKDEGGQILPPATDGESQKAKKKPKSGDGAPARDDRI